MNSVFTPAQARIPIGTVVIAGRSYEVAINAEWAKFIESLTTATNANTIYGINGRNGVDGPAVGIMASGSDSEVEFIPGPQGIPGRQGEPGPALFMLADDNGGGSDMVIPFTSPAEGRFVPLSSKDASGGVPGMTLFNLNLRNVANTFTSFLTNAATAVRTWTMPDKDGTVAMTSDVALRALLAGDSAQAFATSTLTASDQVTATKTYTTAPALRATATTTALGASFASTNSNASQFLVGYSGSSGDPAPAIFWRSGAALRLGTATDYLATGFTLRASLDASGLAVVAGFGCNGKTAQTAVTVNAACTDLPTVIALTNQLRAALIANGITS